MYMGFFFKNKTDYYNENHSCETPSKFELHMMSRLPKPMLVILFRSFGFIALKNFKIILAFSVPDEGYSRNASCALNLIGYVQNVYGVFF
jgi:hypothetical protein